MRSHAKKVKAQEPIRDVYQEIASRTPQKRGIAVYNNGKVASIDQTVKVRTRPIAIGIPLDELLFSNFFQNYAGLTIMPWDDILMSGSTYLPEARNAIHGMFLDHSEAEYLFMLDSDVLPPPSIIDRLLAHHLPLVGGWYRKKAGNNPPVVYDYKGIDEKGLATWLARDQPGAGLEKVDGAGAGCWLMRRDVAKSIGHDPYDMLRGGEDLDLCLKVTAAGFPIHIDWSLACAHAGVMYV